MTYFFISLLQATFPMAILLGCLTHSSTPNSPRKLIWLSLLGFLVGAVVQLNLPQNQMVNLSVALFMSLSLLLFYAGSLLTQSLRLFFFVLLSLLAGLNWAKNPNMAVLTHFDVINTDFILYASAVILGLFLTLFITCWLNLLLKQFSHKILRLLLLTSLTFVLLLSLTGDILLILMKLQWLELTKLRLSFVAQVTNLASYFNYISATMLALVILIFWKQIYLTRKSAVQQSQHPIETRQKKAALLYSQRLLAWGTAALLLIFGSQLYWDKVVSLPPQLSEATKVLLDEKDQVAIPIEQMKDGKLHRFVWVADDGKAVRFFIINRQPSRLSLAVVFDACILCGDQGYVMEGDQVVCIGCGVRMFIPSIGKPGGCNPVPMENWQQTDNHIIIHKKSLEEGLNYFSTVLEIEVIDPVNHQKLTNTKTEHKYSYGGKTYFFANEQNLELFRNNPEQYINKKEPH